MRKKFFCVGNYGHKRAEGTVAMRKKFFCVGNYGHMKAKCTLAMRKKFSVYAITVTRGLKVQ